MRQVACFSPRCQKAAIKGYDLRVTTKTPKRVYRDVLHFCSQRHRDAVARVIREREKPRE